MALNFYLAERLSRYLADSPKTEDTNAKTEVVPQSQAVQIHNPPPSPASRSQGFTHYSFDRKLAENALSAHGRDVIFQPLRAYVEKALNDTVPGTIDKGNLDEKRPKIEVGKPAKFYVPLQLREGPPEDVSHI